MIKSFAIGFSLSQNYIDFLFNPLYNVRDRDNTFGTTQRRDNVPMEKKQAKFRLLVGAWHLLKQIMAFGNPTAGGFATMEAVLRAVGELNRVLYKQHGIELYVSAHLNHELAVPVGVPGEGQMAQYNNPRAISLDDWMKGIEHDEFAQFGRIIPPGFGYEWSDMGAFINPDPVVRRTAHDMMGYAFRLSSAVKEADAGLGDVIYWDGPDGIRWKRLVEGDDPILSYENNPQLDEWQLIIRGVGNAIKAAYELGYIDEKKDRLLIEGKAGGDPCYIAAFTDPHLEVRAINEINAIAGIDVAYWQGEFCHTRGGGMKFADGMRIAIEGGVFDGPIHFNSGGIASVNFSDLLTEGAPMSCFQQYVDPDFLPGQGVGEWIDDQRESLRVGVEWSTETGKPLEVEFDARFCREREMMAALLRASEWTIGELTKLGAVPA
jgi:hypothetical protein